MLAGALDLLFPRLCAGCGGPGWPFCEPCLRRVALLEPPGCSRCGRPFEWDVDRCPECPPAPIAWARAPFLYEGPVRRALMGLKFGGHRSLASALAPWMERALRSAPRSADDTCLTWVPLGRRRRRDRGYDQAEALARAVALLTRHPVRALLRRPVETAPQARRSGRERRQGLDAVFSVAAPPPARVVLVDDVLTSGATGAACARILIRAGAVEVGVLTAARSLRGPVPARCHSPPAGGSPLAPSAGGSPRPSGEPAADRGRRESGGPSSQGPGGAGHGPSPQDCAAQAGSPGPSWPPDPAHRGGGDRGTEGPLGRRQHPSGRCGLRRGPAGAAGRGGRVRRGKRHGPGRGPARTATGHVSGQAPGPSGAAVESSTILRD